MPLTPRSILVAASAFVCAASPILSQESRPAVRPDGSVRFHKVEGAPAFAKDAIIAQASTTTDTITVLVNGVVHTSVENRSVSDVLPDEGRRRREHWTGTLSRSALQRIEVLGAAGRAALSFSELLDLARVPFHARPRVDFALDRVPWSERHQEPDGSWSPADYDWNCDESIPPVCTGTGQESFRMAATALVALGNLHAGYFGRPGPQKALSYLRACRHRDGSFADPGDPAFAMTNASVAIVFSQAATFDRAPAFMTDAGNALRALIDHQDPDGSFGRATDEAQQLSATVWALLAMKAAAVAGVATDDGVPKRALSWVERTVASIEAIAKVDARTLARARAARGCARAAAGGDRNGLEQDVAWLIARIEKDKEPFRDAETLLFGTLAAQKAGKMREWAKIREWAGLLKSEVVETQCTHGCGEGTWTTPTIWSDLGGRLVSTALMTWSLELYYRYPKAYWLD